MVAGERKIPGLCVKVDGLRSGRAPEVGSPLSPMQEVWRRIRGLQALAPKHLGALPNQGSSVDSPSAAALLAVSREEGPQAKPQADAPKRRCVVSLSTMWVACALGVALIALLGGGVTARLVAKNVAHSSGAATTRCLRTAQGPRVEEGLLASCGQIFGGDQILQSMVLTFRPGTADSVMDEYMQRVLACNSRRPEEPPLFAEVPCSFEPAQGATPVLGSWMVVWFPLAGAWFLAMGIFAIGLQWWASLPLRHLMRFLDEFENDPLHAKSSVATCYVGEPSRITEIYKLQRTVKSLMHSMNTFGRFLPVKVAQQIAFGDERSSRPHVASRHVTIMFSDMQDFTKLSETLLPCDMLFIMTRYLSVMIRIVEMYEGTVGELQGDGLLAYWNTPTSVEDHVAKACNAAVAKQDALRLLNVQFAELGLPQLAIRIGLHSGPVLSGILGSESRMKFGCMGDAVNLTSRLEGLCKYYGVTAVCSAAVRQSLPSDSGFLLRRLDTVQVKGRQAPIAIYELMGKDPGGIRQTATTGTPPGLSPCIYEQALDAYQEGNFHQAVKLASQVLQAQPEDSAAGQLLKRAASCLDEQGHVRLSKAELEGWSGVLAMNEK